MEKKITLVVVDFQYDFCLLGAPLYVPGSDRALWNISHLIENKKIGEVIFTADWHPANHCSFKRNVVSGTTTVCSSLKVQLYMTYCYMVVSVLEYPIEYLLRVNYLVQKNMELRLLLPGLNMILFIVIL